MAVVLKPGAVVQGYNVIELVGDGTQSNVYLAERDNMMHWLIHIESPDWEPNVRSARVERFQTEDGNWVALEASGTRMVELASWVDKLELPFLGWRWAQLAREIGFAHTKDVVLQQARPLSLERLVFNRQGELIVSQTDSSTDDEYTFLVPEQKREMTPASDVFALGASLRGLAGENLPRDVAKVLERATSPDATKRYRNGKEFCEALAEVLPDPAREKLASPRKRSVWKWAIAVGVLVCGGLALCVALAIWLISSQLLLTEPQTKKEIPLRVTILKWNVEGKCDARVGVRAAEGGFVVTTNEGAQFAAIESINKLTAGI